MKPLDRKAPSPRKPSTPPRYSGIHGGSIDSWAEYDGTPQEPDHSSAQAKHGSVTPRVAVAVAGEEPQCRSLDEQLNAFDVALSKSETGRKLLTLLEEVAKLRIHEQLAAELARGAAEDVERIKRVLCGRDLIARENAAAKLPHAEASLSRWRGAHANLQSRREILEYTMHDLTRALPL